MITPNTQLTSPTDTYHWLIRTVIYLLVTVSAIRGLIIYADQWPALVTVLALLGIAIAVEKQATQQGRLLKWGYVLLHLSLVSVLFSIARYADYWSLLLFPICYMTPRLFNSQESTWAICMTVATMIVCLWLAEGGVASLLYSSVYLVSYLMIFAFSKIILQLDRSLTDAKTLSNQLAKANNRLRSYAEQSANVATSEAKHAVARDLHDSVTQTLFSINLMLSSLLARPNNTESHERSELKKIQDLSESAMKELRGVISHLRPSTPPQIPFRAQLQQVISNIQQHTPLNVTVHYDGQIIPKHAIASIIQIVREALLNIAKHAKTLDAEITFQQVDGLLTIEIIDHGCGFIANREKESGHMGLETLRLHSLELGAQLNIQTAPTKGCRISLSMPMNIEVE